MGAGMSASSNKHTPGPWSVRFFKSKSHKVSAPTWESLAVVYGNVDDKEFDAEGRANARLVAAAPDLLADVKALLNLLDYVRLDADGMKAFRQARTHVAKAEGDAKCDCGGTIYADPHGRFDDLCSTCIDESDRERERARRNTGATAQDEKEGIR